MADFVALLDTVPGQVTLSVFARKANMSEAAHSGPGIARKIAQREGGVFETRSFTSLAKAEAAALEWAGSPQVLAKHYRGAI